MRCNTGVIIPAVYYSQMTWQLLKKDVVNKEQYMQNVVEGVIEVCGDVHSEVEN